MASLLYKKNTGKYQIRFFYNKEPHWIMLTTGDKKAATTIMNMVERRLVQMKNGEPDRVLDNWIAAMPDDLRQRFQKAGLLAETKRAKKLVEVSLEFLTSKQAGWKAITAVRRQNEHNWLIKFFGQDKHLEDITKKDATDYLNYLSVINKLSNVFVNKLMKFATSVYEYAIEAEYVNKRNPFKGVRVPNTVQREKQYITVEYTEKLIEACPTVAWKTMVALLRYRGLRPEEAILAKWSGIDWDKGSFEFASPKTANHAGKDKRVIPLFPRLKEALLIAQRAASDKDTYILSGKGWDSKRKGIEEGRAGTTCELSDYIKKAGLDNPGAVPTNMRGSCSTDLKQVFPEFVVDSWLGHSSDIAHKHYDVVLSTNMELATKNDFFSSADSATNSATVDGCNEQKPTVKKTSKKREIAPKTRAKRKK